MTTDFSSDYHVAELEHYTDRDVIFKEGTPGDWIYVILKGEVEIFKTIRGRKVVVDILKEGEVFGEVSFIDKSPRSAGARAVGDVTLGLFDKEFLTHEYNRLPNNFRLIFDAMARRLRKMTAVATNLAGRKNDRSTAALEVEFKTKDDFFKAWSANIGGGGMFVKTEQILEVGREVTISFRLPGDKMPIVAKGKVSWHKNEPDQGVGIQFTSMTPEDKTRLTKFLRVKS